MKKSRPKFVLIDFPSDVSSLKKFEKFLNELRDKYEISDEDFYRIYLTSSEAFINALFHGNKLEAVKRIWVKFKVFKKSFEIEIQDEGEGFEPESIPDPTANENLLKESGRGIYIIKAFSDGVKFLKTQKGMKVKIKIKKRPGAL